MGTPAGDPTGGRGSSTPGGVARSHLDKSVAMLSWGVPSLQTPQSPQARVTTGLDNLKRLVHAEPERKLRDGCARAIPPEIISTVGGGEATMGERPQEAARSSELAGGVVANAAPAHPQQRLEGGCSGAASWAEVNPERGPVPSEQSGCCVVDPNGIVGVWSHTIRQLRDERMLHLFAGRPRLGSLAHAAEQWRVTVDQIDLMCCALQLRAAAWCDWHVANALSGAAGGSKRAAAESSSMVRLACRQCAEWCGWRQQTRCS